MPGDSFNDLMATFEAPDAINKGLARPAGTGSTNDLLFTLWGGSEPNLNDRGMDYFAGAPDFTGGTIANDTVNGYRYHVFRSSGTLTMVSPGNVEVFVVAGGGSGGGSGGTANAGGGGGAGGVISTTVNITASQTITVGAGGLAVGPNQSGNIGSNSSVGSLVVAAGGGRGGSTTVILPGTPSAGGSGGGGGGGGASTGVGQIGGAASPAGQGNNGGNGWRPATTANTTGGGGGGATSAGADGINLIAGAGGTGMAPSWIAALNALLGGSPVPARYAGGGGGGSATGTGGTAVDGGGAGSRGVAGVAGTANTGGGGGGTNGFSSGAGGSGIVIIRYPI